MKRNAMVLFLLMLISPFIISAQTESPMLFQLEWGASFNQVQQRVLERDVNLGRLVYYDIYEGRTEQIDLRSSSTVKYITKGTPFFSIPADVIFTFYNPSNSKEALRLSKIEVFLNKKDSNDIWVDIKSVYRDFIRFFIDNYNIDLKYNVERQIFSDYEYQVTVNGIYVNFIANVGNNILDKDKAIFFSYESNQYQYLILKKEKELLENQIPKTEEEKLLKNTKTNL